MRSILALVFVLASCGEDRCASNLPCDLKVQTLSAADQRHLCVWALEKLAPVLRNMKPCGELQIWPQLLSAERCVENMKPLDETVRAYEDALRRRIAAPCNAAVR
jgi:hypothetical protein